MAEVVENAVNLFVERVQEGDVKVLGAVGASVAILLLVLVKIFCSGAPKAKQSSKKKSGKARSEPPPQKKKAAPVKPEKSAPVKPVPTPEPEPEEQQQPVDVDSDDDENPKAPGPTKKNPLRSDEEREKEKARKAAKKARKEQADKAEKAAGKKKDKTPALSKADEDAGWVLEDGTGKKKAPVIAAPAAPAAPVETKITVMVESKKIGVVIGPKGTTLQLIQNKTATKIDIPQRAEGTTAPAKVTVTGEPEGCQDAKKCIEDMCSKGYSAMLMGDDFLETSVDVHPMYISHLIGSKGAVIRAIRDVAGATLTMPDRNTYNPQTTKRVKVGVAGPKASVSIAKDIIAAIQRVFHHDSTHPGVTHVEVEVPWEYLNIIIGRGGSEIRHIQANFKVEVYVPNEHSVNQKIVVVGPKLFVGSAEKYIKKLVQNAIEAPQAMQQTEPVDKFGDESAAVHEEWMDEYLYRRPDAGW
jgi:rRNA processing protein Krr1/Pno1